MKNSPHPLTRLYLDPVIEHFMRPRNVGEIEDADGVGSVGDPECGDFFRVSIRVEGEILADVKYKVFGCPTAIACCSMMSELAIGKTVEAAYHLDDVDIMHALGGLSEAKQHCSNHAATALHEAINDFMLGTRTGEEA
jgi:nitrogen fixation NifU-like protein